MTRITDRLKQINERLDLPQPARSRVLLEIAGDLYDLEKHFLDDGLTREEAQQRALEMCDLSDEAIAQLIQVHAGGFRRFLERFSSQAQTRWERILLLFVLGGIAWSASRWLLTAHFFSMAGPVLWPILALTFLAVMLILPKYYAAFLKQDHNPARLRAGLTLVPVIAVVNLLIGIYGFWLGLYPIVRRAVHDQEELLSFVIIWLHRGSAMLALCLLSSILITMLWFILTNKVSRIEQAEASALLSM